MPYSNKIYDQSFDKYLRNTRNWKFQFSLILAALAIAGFSLYGALSDEMDNPEALQIGMGIGLLFILIGFISGKSTSNNRTWDGVVIDKKIKKTTKDIGYGDGKAERYVFTVLIKSENGKVHEIRDEDDETVYNYYKIGDKVRHHGRLNTYEKFDKSGDTIIFCSACAFLHDIHEDVCRNCGCPLLK
ncbi:hypothetical protein PbJCM13498_34540 [Prolixibacter bellariivorans]|uniref:Uncharacterized protein n=1 Tax=Prolixibacter bellariivorans TaxID=314319 RepID=A0A5M4B3X7_9BACT|nr:hypothetical protein [Prolixibacter bellariivorans]GET34591.1 hypothetical protein PbJCM13498_34540 [Prolixibacter bellariivorans]